MEMRTNKSEIQEQTQIDAYQYPQFLNSLMKAFGFSQPPSTLFPTSLALNYCLGPMF